MAKTSEDKVSEWLEQLIGLEDTGDVRRLKVQQQRKVKFDARGTPVEDQREPTTVAISFVYGGRKKS